MIYLYIFEGFVDPLIWVFGIQLRENIDSMRQHKIVYKTQCGLIE